MKAKQIEKLLKGMVDKFCESISEEEIKTIIKEKSYIAGGCIPSMLLGEFVNDFDIYFQNRDDANKVKGYYEKISKNVDKESPFHVKLITENSVNLSDKIQLIIKFIGAPEDVTDKFDWKHIKSYYLYPDKLILREDVYKLIVEKELVYTGSAYPVSSLMRLKKFIKKGWEVSNSTILNIVLDAIQAFYSPQKPYNKDDLESLQQTEGYVHKFSVEEILYHLNGVDPSTIQKELEEKAGERLSIKEIINLID